MPSTQSQPKKSAHLSAVLSTVALAKVEALAKTESAIKNKNYTVLIRVNPCLKKSVAKFQSNAQGGCKKLQKFAKIAQKMIKKSKNCAKKWKKMRNFAQLLTYPLRI